MTKLLTTISGQFTKAFILGAFFPAAVFVVLNILLILPLFPSGLSPAKYLADFDKEWQAAIALFVAIVVSGLLYNLNLPLIRFYEGYLFEDSWLGRKMRDRQANKLAWMNQEISRLEAERESMSRDDPNYAKVSRELPLLGFKRQVRFPLTEESVTPTNLGNVIAAFEHYAYKQYGIDSVVLWPRLVAKIDATYAGIVDDAKTSFDFFINGSFLFAILALEHLYLGIYFRTHSSSVPDILVFLFTTAVLAGVSWLSYRASIDSATAWGDYVKSAFDLYRWDLLTTLGYQTELTSSSDEAEFWKRVTQGIAFGKPETLPPYKKAKPSATRVEPTEIKWSITKGIEEPKPSTGTTASTVIKYILKAKNIDTKHAKSATLFDTVPSGFDYIASSAQLHKSGQSDGIEADGTNPYSWELGAVDAGQSVTITYSVLLRPDVSKVSN